METRVWALDDPSEGKAVTCPKCGASMHERTRRSDGHRFMGCNDYPKCKGTRDVEDPGDYDERDSMLEDFGLFHE